MLLYYVSSSVKLPFQGLSINPASLMTVQLLDEEEEEEEGSLHLSKTHERAGLGTFAHIESSLFFYNYISFDCRVVELG